VATCQRVDKFGEREGGSEGDLYMEDMYSIWGVEVDVCVKEGWGWVVKVELYTTIAY